MRKSLPDKASIKDRLASADLNFFPRRWLRLHQPDTVFHLGGLLAIETESVALMGFGDVGNLETFQTVLVLSGHLRHLDGESRQHPRAVDGHQVFHPETPVGGMKVSRVQHLVAEMAEEHPSRKVAVEGLGYEFVCSGFIHFQFLSAATM